MIEFLDCEQGTHEWLMMRRGGIGASDISAIMGKNPWKTPLMVYEEKMEAVQQEENEDMRRGKELEPWVRRMISERYSRHYEPFVVKNSNYPNFFASLDGWDENLKMGIEIKCPRKHAPAIPEAYILQMQWQMMMCGVWEWLYVSYDGQEIIELPVVADTILQEEMKEAGEAFFLRMISYDPPDPTDKDYQVISDPEAIKKAITLAGLKAAAKDTKAYIEELEEDLKKICNGKSSFVGDLRITRYQKAGNVDYKAIPELQSVDLNKYRKPPTTQWRFT